MACRLKDDNMNRNDETEDLFIFGYSCKLFRDDDKALYIDQGKHLIPWMGDDTLKIDRYDARGTLYDLKHAEAPSGGFDRFFGLTDIERQVENMCDEERYRALMTNEEEESMYQEEELKRLHFAIGEKGKEYGQVEYKYDGNSNPVEDTENEKTVVKIDDAGEDEPFVPSPQLDVPLNMVLPETNKHNAIIEKTAMFINSQGPQMEILLKMKQAGNPQFNFLSFDNPLHSYYRHLLMAIKGGRYKPEIAKSDEKKDNENEEDDHYLHPSLACSVSKVELAPSIPSINYKPSAHCAYSMLVNKIKDKKSKGTKEPLIPTHFNTLKQALERFNTEQAREENNSSNESDSNCSTESRSSLKSKSSSRSSVSICSVKYNPNAPAQTFETPPTDMQIIIDKMASYVAKNGRDFETVVQMKKDPRFDFLHSSHVYNLYYQHKVRQYENLEKCVRSEDKNKCSEICIKTKDDQLKAKLAPVCFSIKKPKESETVIEKSALPVEESSDEERKEDDKKESIILDAKEKDEKDGMITMIDLAAVEEKEEKNKKILAAERIKDKLTAAVREKVALASKEKQLQLERKRRAAVFLKNLQTESGGLKMVSLRGSRTATGNETAERITDDEEGEDEGGEESDVLSLPDAIEDEDEEKKEASTGNKAENRYKCQQDNKCKERHKISNATWRHKNKKERHGEKSEKKDRVNVDEGKWKEMNDRVTDSSVSSDENDKRKNAHNEDIGRRIGKIKKVENSKSDRNRSCRNEEEHRRHRRKKHKRGDGKDRNTRKHSKSKKQKRSKGSEDDENDEDDGDGEDREKGCRSKRSRKHSASNLDDHAS